jgi:transposase
MVLFRPRWISFWLKAGLRIFFLRSTKGRPDSVGQKLLEHLKGLSILKENLLIGLEASGGFWENLYFHLKENGFSIVLLNPYHTNKFREALAKKAKIDDISTCRQTGLHAAGRDALVIAQLLRTGEYVQSQVAEETIQSLREITNLRYELIK